MRFDDTVARWRHKEQIQVVRGTKDRTAFCR
jgi:hypothetical protein